LLVEQKYLSPPLRSVAQTGIDVKTPLVSERGGCSDQQKHRLCTDRVFIIVSWVASLHRGRLPFLKKAKPPLSTGQRRQHVNAPLQAARTSRQLHWVLARQQSACWDCAENGEKTGQERPAQGCTTSQSFLNESSGGLHLQLNVG
jgi:hypothetical protein